MKLSIHITVLLLFSVCLLSCEKEANFKGAIPAAKLVLNSVVNTDSLILSLGVSSSKFALDENKNTTMSLPSVHCEVSGKNIPILKSKSTQNTPFNFSGKHDPLKPGDKIKVSCFAPGFPAVEAEDIVPLTPAATSAVGKWDLNLGEGKDRVFVELKINDSPDARNFYRIIIRSRLLMPGQPPVAFAVREIRSGNDPVLSEKSTVTNQSGSLPYVIFSDDLINGKEYTLRFWYEDENYEKHKNNPFYVPGTKYEAQVELQALSENLYRYMHTLYLNKDNDAFSEPVKVHSNVKGGYGIIGIFSPKKISVNIEEYK